MNTGTSLNNAIEKETIDRDQVETKKPTAQEVERLRSMLNTYKKKNLPESFDFQKENEKKDNEINDLKKDLNVKLKEINDLKVEWHKSINELKSFKDQSIENEKKILDLKEENDSLIDQQKKLLSKYSLLKASFNESVKKDDERDRLEELNKELSDLKSQYQVLKNSSIEKENQIETLKSFEKELREIKPQYESLKNSNFEIENHLNLLKETTQALDDLRFQHEEVKKSVLEKEYKLHESLSQNRLLKDQLEKNIESLQEKDKKIVDTQSIEYVYKKVEEEKLKLETQVELERKINFKLRTENEVFLEKQKNTQVHVDQLERAFEHIRQRYEESELELTQLREDFRRSEESTLNLNEQKDSSLSRIDTLSTELKNIKDEKNELVEELNLLNHQFGNLKAKIADQSKEIETLNESKSEIEKAFVQKSELVNQLENEISLLKEKNKTDLDKDALRETLFKQIECEKIDLNEKLKNVVLELEQKEVEIKALKKEHLLIQEKENNYKIQINELKEKESLSLEILKKQIHRFEEELNHKNESLRQKENMLNDLNQQSQLHAQEKYKWQETLSQSKQAHVDQEARIRVAQQHLGKKLKEFAIINEKLEEMRRSSEDLQIALQDEQNKSKQLEQSYEEKLKSEKQVQEDLKNKIEQLDHQKAKLETKIEETSHKLNQYIDKNEQMQKLFSNIQGVIAGNREYKQEENDYKKEIIKKEKKFVKPISFDEDIYQAQEKNVSHDRQESIKQAGQVSFFEYEQKHTPMRQTLFD